ncbi:diphenol oxidase-A2 [Coniophora puteana RWD-64-598 SS2]|uniref:Diphenol oxidase-A2 n=1 Tax=Coniophora puteana (strain RWD-64-598) TaxID=741705 RepID=A0A5M3MIC5_CONPW|nr:diphenol oxidase-A2 [Coniophora puteana RWD-64-598 SS2]EIW78381.1 diphenol oxidase-A2 [Coniophora puteana RWD-64-598 SS2]
MSDVPMNPPADKKTDEKSSTEETKKATPKPPPPPAVEIKANIGLIERAVNDIEPRFTHRVLRSLTALRKRINYDVLREAVEQKWPGNSSQVKAGLLAWLPPASSPSGGDMDVDKSADAKGSDSKAEPVPEAEIYFRLLLIHHMHTSPDTYRKSIELANDTVEKIQVLNRRSMDPIAAKVWFALERSYELGGELADARPLFLAAQRTAALRNDDDTLASLINRLLRNYLHYSLFDLADKLVSKTTFPASASNAQLARYHYSLGRIKAVQLNYTAAHTHLQQAIRRAPAAKVAPGFYQAVHKLSVVVELLMGDIPERSTFRHPVLERPLEAYFDIVKAVRSGSLEDFQNTLARHAETLKADKTYTLILRLRQNVIKTGIRRLSLSYARIALRDICMKLHLDSEEDAEYIVGKAIRDGVIDATIVHEQGWMVCNHQRDAYGPEVADVFGKRIGYCLELHNQSVKAMRYPLNAHRKELTAAENARERERELARDIQEGDFDGDEDGPGGHIGDAF